jgi:putative effector of murein hydrolase
MTDTAALDPVITHPLFGLALTIGVYLVAMAIYDRLGQPPLLHPVLTSVATVAVVMLMAGMTYTLYFAQAAPLHNALGVLVVLLAVPLVRQLQRIREARLAIFGTLVAGSIVALITALSPLLAMGVAPDVVASLTPKSATAAVAVGIAERVGGVAGLAAMAAVLTGLFGAMIGPSLLSAIGVRDHRAVGFAIGIAAHAIGTARAFQISETAGAFATLGMILNAILTVALAPLALSLMAT